MGTKAAVSGVRQPRQRRSGSDHPLAAVRRRPLGIPPAGRLPTCWWGARTAHYRGVAIPGTAPTHLGLAEEALLRCVVSSHTVGVTSESRHRRRAADVLPCVTSSSRSSIKLGLPRPPNAELDMAVPLRGPLPSGRDQVKSLG